MQLFWKGIFLIHRSDSWNTYYSNIRVVKICYSKVWKKDHFSNAGFTWCWLLINSAYWNTLIPTTWSHVFFFSKVLKERIISWRRRVIPGLLEKEKNGREKKVVIRSALPHITCVFQSLQRESSLSYDVVLINPVPPHKEKKNSTAEQHDMYILLLGGNICYASVMPRETSIILMPGS